MGGNVGAELTADSARALARNVTDYEGDVDFKNWSQDPYARGSYSVLSKEIGYFIPWERNPDMPQFARPIGSFTFAGEHAEMNSSYIDSAVRSGERAGAYISGFLKANAS